MVSINFCKIPKYFISCLKCSGSRVPPCGRKNTTKYERIRHFRCHYTVKRKDNEKFAMSTPRTHICGEEVWLHSILTSTIDGQEWLTSSPVHLTLEKNTLTPLNRRLVGPQSRSGRFGERKFLAPIGIRIPRKETMNNSLISITQTEILN